jgi:hypothetical protein
MKKYGYLWVTLGLFLLSLGGHWIAAWFAYVDEQQSFRHAVDFNEYLVQTLRDTLENWQSEFLQLAWQVAGLAYLWYVGSPQSKEGDDRKEEKLDEILKLLDKKGAQKTIAALDRKYPKE